MSNRTVANSMILFLLCLPTFAQNQYTTAYTKGLTDVTPYAATTNLWQEIPGGGICQQGTAAEGYDGWVFCKGTDNQIYKRDYDARTWAAIPAMGTSVVALAVREKNNVWALIPDATCQALTPPAFGLYHWAGGKWTLPVTPQCLNKITIGHDNTLAGILNKPSSAMIAINPAAGVVFPPSNNELHYSVDSGKTWTMYAANWDYVSMWSKNIGCAISGQGYLYQVSFYSGLDPVSLEPPGTPTNPILPRFISCVIPQSDPLVMAVGDNAIWLSPPNRDIIPGPALTQLMSASKGATLGLDSSGHIYHWNIYPEITLGTTTGTYNACPQGSPCPVGIKHEIQLGIHYPHSIGPTCGNCGAGQFQDVFIPATNAASLTAWDANPFCDPVFGDPNSPECAPGPPQGEDVCPLAGVIGSPGAITLPYLGNAWVKRGYGQPTYPPPYIEDGKYVCTASWPVIPDCKIGTQSQCPIKELHSAIKVKIAGSGGMALLACEADARIEPYQGPDWIVVYLTDPNIGLANRVCVKVNVVEHQIGPGSCF